MSTAGTAQAAGWLLVAACLFTAAQRAHAQMLVLQQRIELPSIDRARQQLYVICGEGFVEVVRAVDGARLAASDRISTAPGARTGLFVPELSRCSSRCLQGEAR